MEIDEEEFELALCVVERLTVGAAIEHRVIGIFGVILFDELKDVVEGIGNN